MGHADKGLVHFQGRPLLEHAIEKLQTRVSAVMISANRNLDAYARYGLPVLPDVTADFSGPLSGVQAGLAACKTDWLLTLPCDVPLFPENLLERMSQALARSDNADLAIVQAQGERQWVFLLMQTALRADLETYLSSGRRSVHGWVDHLGKVGRHCIAVDMEDAADCFHNLNTLEELRRLESGGQTDAS